MLGTTLSLTAAQHRQLVQHLFPGDGKEAVAFLLCGIARGKSRRRLVARRVFPVPHAACSLRAPDRVTWPTNAIIPALNEAALTGLAVVKVHGHYSYSQFSDVDDHSDLALFPSVYPWISADVPHASAIVMDDERMFGRVVSDTGDFTSLQCVNVVGPDLPFWFASDYEAAVPEFGRRLAQSFGKGTFDKLRRLRVAVVGCSGTGSAVIEQLARNCVGSLVLVDPDIVEDKNLNRIWNSTRQDAASGTEKVEVAARAITAMGMGTRVETFAKNAHAPEVVSAIAECDVLFGCVDSIDGRYLLNKLSTFYTIPYFDLGVRLESDGNGGVAQVCGSVHYLEPGGSSMMSRNVFTMEQVRAAGIRRVDPEGYSRLLEEGYIRGAQEDRPAVIQLNTLIASLAVNEFLARLHPYRIESNDEYSVHRISLSHGIYEHTSGGANCPILAHHLGRGDVVPPLDMPELSAVSMAQ